MDTLTPRRRASVPRSSFVVPGVAAVAAAAFFVWKPGVAVSMIASPRAFGFAAAVGVLTLALGWVLPRLGRGCVLTALAQSLPVAIAFVLAVLPSFRTRTVNDPFPGAPAAARTPSVPAPAATAPTATGRAAATAGQAVTVGRATLTGIH